MKLTIKNLLLANLTCLVLIGGVSRGYSQSVVGVVVDYTQTWLGYMNWSAYPTDASGYGGTGGGGWGTADLVAVFDATGTNYLTLSPNTSIYRDNTFPNNYWFNADGSSANQMDALMYVEADALAGDIITFSGTCLTNTLTNTFTCTAFIKDLNSGYGLVGSSSTALTAGQPFSVTQYVAPGDHAQYGFETIGPSVPSNAVASYGKVVIAVDNVDPALTPIAPEALVAGQSATFTVKATGSSPFTYQWSQITPTATNVLSNGGRFSLGAATNSMTISNLAVTDAGTYLVVVTNVNGSSASEKTSLIVTPLAQAQTNLLVNPGFELGAFANTAFTNASLVGWVNFNGAAFASTNGTYYVDSNNAPGTVNLTVVDGTNCLDIYSLGQGSYNGAYQDTPALPGQVFTGGAWFLTPATDKIAGTNVCYLEEQFQNSAGTALVDYQSSRVTNTFPANTWIFLQPTNEYAANFTTLLGTSTNMVAPPGTVKVRTQFTYASLGTAGGSVYVDAAVLRQREAPATGFTSRTNANTSFSFPTYYAPVYKVLYKTNLTDASWLSLTNITGDGTVKTVVDPNKAPRRFYIIDNQ